ncbi:hypothetical protein LX97_02227 [Nonlabens dokdonensis]|jgi:Cu/Ag efflux protein CusF|nr:hypothetical protein [Nonlabens dokdonensis]PZX39869.1 hypothetical protein LX97_02227 [Nonlabens dokdonensis]
MKITTSQKAAMSILSLLFAFSILAFQHHENNSQSTNSSSEKNTKVLKKDLDASSSTIYNDQLSQ